VSLPPVSATISIVCESLVALKSKLKLRLISQKVSAAFHAYLKVSANTRAASGFIG
jgi:hypothetical protein